MVTYLTKKVQKNENLFDYYALIYSPVVIKFPLWR